MITNEKSVGLQCGSENIQNKVNYAPNSFESLKIHARVNSIMEINSFT